MADEEDLNEKVKAVIKEKDGAAALDLLIADEAYEISKGDRNRLAALALKEEGVYIAEHYPKIIGLVSGDVVKGLSTDFGKYGEPAAILEVLEDPEHKKHYDAIVTAAISNEDLEIPALYAAAMGSASNDLKDSLITALGRNVDVSNEDLATILSDPAFSAYRSRLLRHLEARMDADQLEELLEEVRSALPDEEIVRVEQVIARRRKNTHG